MSDTPEFDWRLLRAAVVQTGEVTLDDVQRRHVPDLAAAAAKHGLRVTLSGTGIKLSLLFHERAARAPPSLSQPVINSEPVIRLQTAEAVYRHAAQLAFESAKAVTRESHAVLAEQLTAFRDNTGE